MWTKISKISSLICLMGIFQFTFIKLKMPIKRSVFYFFLSNFDILSVIDEGIFSNKKTSVTDRRTISEIEWQSEKLCNSNSWKIILPSSVPVGNCSRNWTELVLLSLFPTVHPTPTHPPGQLQIENIAF